MRVGCRTVAENTEFGTNAGRPSGFCPIPELGGFVALPISRGGLPRSTSLGGGCVLEETARQIGEGFEACRSVAAVGKTEHGKCSMVVGGTTLDGSADRLGGSFVASRRGGGILRNVMLVAAGPSELEFKSCGVRTVLCAIGIVSESLEGWGLASATRVGSSKVSFGGSGGAVPAK